MKIDNIYLEKMRNDAYYQFHTEFKKLVEELIAAIPKIALLFQAYLLLYAKMDAAYKKIAKSPLTELIHEADKARDEVWTGFTEAARAAMRHFDPAIREAARRINIVIKTYGKVPSMVAKKSLNEQTSAIANIVQDLEGAYASDVAAAGLGMWTVELKARNVTLANLMRDRVYEASMKVDTALRKARAELDGKYHEIVELVNALVVVEGVANFEQFIRRLNINIAKFALLIAHAPKKPRKKGGEALQSERGSL